jgi:DivIVA domain-containing protein
VANGFSLGGVATDPARLGADPASVREARVEQAGSGAARRAVAVDAAVGAPVRVPRSECAEVAGVIYPRLTSADLRVVRFERASRRRGVDPEQVYALLSRVADEWDLLHRDLAVARGDATRVKEALRQWQTRNARAVDNRRRGGPR